MARSMAVQKALYINISGQYYKSEDEKFKMALHRRAAMVGVPRSRGCRNCRRKKKGCDLQKPTCGQCARSGIVCGWDEKRWTFVSQDPTAAGAAGSSTMPFRRRSGTEALARQNSAPPPTGPEEQSLSRTAFETGANGDFWTLYLPKDDPRTVGAGGVYAAPWARTVQDLSRFDDTVRAGLNACAMTTLAHVRSDQALLQSGIRLYLKALYETNRALQDPIRAQSDAVLASCNILAMFEILRQDEPGRISQKGHDWKRHIEGVCKIVELRGPAKHVSGHGHALFENARITAVIHALTLRRPNSFSSASWHTIPWESSPRNLSDELCDLMIVVPGLLQRQDVLCQKITNMETYSDRYVIVTEGQEYINRCINLGRAFHEWEQKALQTCVQRFTVASTSPAGPLTLLDICRDCGYGFFNTIMYYWVGCVILYSTTWVVYRSIGSAVRPEQSPSLPTWLRLPEIPQWMNPRHMAANVVTCAPHFFAPEAGFWGAQSASFPVGVALHYYAATGGMDAEAMDRLRELLADASRGRVAGDFLRSLAYDSDAAKRDPRDRQLHGSMASSWYGTDRLQAQAAGSSSQDVEQSTDSESTSESRSEGAMSE